MRVRQFVLIIHSPSHHYIIKEIFGVRIRMRDQMCNWQNVFFHKSIFSLSELHKNLSFFLIASNCEIAPARFAGFQQVENGPNLKKIVVLLKMLNLALKLQMIDFNCYNRQKLIHSSGGQEDRWHSLSVSYMLKINHANFHPK